jgi:Tfp pilus assembly protein PilN
VSTRLALQIDDDALRAVVAEGQHPLEVRLITLSRTGTLDTQLMELMAQAPGAKVSLVLPPSCQDHLTLALPPLPPHEARVIVEREVRKQLPSEETAFAFAAGPKAQEGAKTDYQVAMAPRGAIEAQLALIEAAGAKAERFLTVSTALAQAVSLHREDLSKLTCAVVHVGRSASHIAVVSGGGVSFSRRIACGCAGEEAACEIPAPEGAGVDSPEDEAALRLATEISRTVLYFKQRFRGREVDRLLLCGGPGLERMVEPLADRCRLSAALFTPGEAVEVAAGGEAGQLSAFALALGALAPGADGLNLLPAEYIERGRRRFWNAVMYGAAAALLLCAGAGWLGMRLAADSYAETLRAQEPSIQAADRFLTEKERIDRERAVAASRGETLKRLGYHSEPWLALLARLSASTPPGVKLDSLKVVTQGEGAGLTLSGQVEAADAFEASSRYAHLHEGLAGSTVIAGFKDRSETTSEPVSDSKGREVGRRSRLKFDVTGSLYMGSLNIGSPGRP